MSTIDTSTWNPDADFNTEIEGIPLNSDADIAQTWKVIAILMAAMKGDTNAIKAMISVMEGATASADGTSGLVPKPEAGDQNKFLKGDGTWGMVEAGDVSIAWENIEDKPNTFPPSTHTHGNVANDGKLLASGSPATDKVVVTDASGNIIATSNVSRQELGYLNGATSNVQTQINAKAADSNVVHKTGNETVGGNKTLSGYLIKNGALGVSGVDNGSIYVCNGTGPTDGGGVWLYGKNHENAGKVRLQAYNGTYYYYEVNSDGTSKTNTTLNIFKGNASSPGLLLEGGGQNFAISAVDTSCKKGTPPSTNKYWGIDFYGEDHDSYNKRIGMVETVILKDSNKCQTSLIAYNCTTNTNTETCAIRAIVDASGNKYTEAPTPSDPVDSSTKIATTAWAFPRICKYISLAATDTVDLNDYTTPGVYQFVNNNNATFLNVPEGVNGTLFVIGASNRVVRQIWFRWGTNNSNDHHVFIRQYVSGASTAWSSWTRLFTDKDTIPVGNGGTGSTTKNFVDLSTNQDIGGNKIFTSEVKILKPVGTVIRINANDLTKGTPPSSQKNFFIPFDDNSGGRFFALEGIVRTSGETVFRAYAFKNVAGSSDNTSISLVYPASGDPYATAPTPSSVSDDSSKIATTAWVRDATGNFACNAATATKATQDGSGNVITSTYLPLSGGTMSGAITRNGNFLQSGNSAGAMSLYSGTSASHGAGIWLYGKDHSGNPGRLNIQTSDGTSYYWIILQSSNKLVRFSSTIIGVRSEGQATLGDGNNRWGQIYTTTPVDSSSDERLKQQIDSIPDDVLDAWGEVDWLQFKFNDSVEEKGADKARLHTGLIAQRIEEKFAIRGLDASRYGLFCYDEWAAQPEERNEDGQVVSEAKAAGNEYSIRYAEALCMEAAYQRRRADRLEARIKALEEKLK